MTARRLALRIVQVFGGLVVLAVVGILAANCQMTRSTNAAIFATATEVSARTYAIVPGARVWSDGTPSDALVDRIDAARALFAAGRVQMIFVSGDGKTDEDGVMARWLVAHGVPAARVIRDGAGYRTRDTFENAHAIGIRDAVVCTQRFHLARSIAWARHLGIDAVGFEADYVEYTHHYRDTVRESIARIIAMVEMWRD